MAQEVKSRKPANTAFRQQRLKAWQPILTPKTVLPTFFIVGIIFAPIGGVLLYASDTVDEIVIDYTDCYKYNTGTFVPIPSSSFSTSISGTNSTPDFAPRYMAVPTSTPLPNSVLGSNPNGYSLTLCRIQFTVPTVMKAPVFVYYRLTNFYQNHRRYVKSYDAEQLKGTAISGGQARKNCNPLDVDPNGIPYFPCGLIANSQFNDTIGNFTLTNVPGGTTLSNTTYNFYQTNIAWPTDKYKYGPTQYQPNQVVPPPNWAPRYPNGSYSALYPPPNLQTDEHFQVWMRTAGLPTFRKLWGRNDMDSMNPGTYQVDIELNFDVTKYGGTKSIVITTTSFLGGKNPFLGMAYIAVGCACVFFGVIFTARHCFKPRKLGDHAYLSWNKGHSGPRNE